MIFLKNRHVVGETLPELVDLALASSGRKAPDHNRTEVHAFVTEQIESIPDILSLPLLALWSVFYAYSLCCIPGCNDWYEALKKARSAWKECAFGPFRDFIRLIDSLTILRTFEDWEPSASVKTVTRIPSASLHRGSSKRFDVVIVGSGPGGSVAAQIWREAGAHVAVLEEGQYLDLDSCSAFSGSEMRQKYRSGGLTVAVGNPKIAYAEGRCAGGGSEINSGLYHRTPAGVLESWGEQFGLEGVEGKALDPHFDACEKALSVSYLEGKAPEASLRLERGAKALGWLVQEVPRWFKPDATGYGGGRRQSMTQTILPQFIASDGCFFDQTRVSRISRHGSGWRVGARRDSRIVNFEAERVVLAGGAIRTAQLLLKSGIGRNVGRSFEVHPTLKVVALFDEEVNTPGMGVPVHQIKQFAPRITMGCSISSKQHLALAMIDHPEQLPTVESTWRRMAIYYVMVTPYGSGKIIALPAFNDPLVAFNAAQKDIENLEFGFSKLCEVLFAAGAVKLYPCVRNAKALSNQEPFNARDALGSLRQNTLMTIHLFGTCPIGENVSRCTADSFGCFHGEKNLFVSDSSMLPTATGVNPQGTIMAIARRNALFQSSRARHGTL